MNPGGRRTHLRRLGIVFAASILVGLPYIVTATSYISASSTGTLTTGSTNVASTGCGWWKDSSIDAEISATALTTTFTSGGSAIPTAGTLTVTANVVDSSTYEYLEDEVVFGCLTTPVAPASTSITVTVSSATVSGAAFAELQITNAEPVAGQNPSTVTTTKVACGSSGPDTPAQSASADFPVADVYAWDAVSHSNVCGTLSLTISPASGITTDTGYMWISLAFLTTGATGLSASAAFSMGFTATVSG